MSRRGPGEPKMAQEGPKMAQDKPNMVPRGGVMDYGRARRDATNRDESGGSAL